MKMNDQNNPAFLFEKSVRMAVEQAMATGLPPSMVVGTLNWVAFDVYSVVRNSPPQQPASPIIKPNTN